jgi:hypothetical protein
MPVTDPLGHQKEAVSVREYLELKIAALEDRLGLEGEMNQRAISKAEDSMNTRLNSMNEFRAQMKDQQTTLLPRAEFNQFVSSTNTRLSTIDERIKDLETFKAVLAGKASVPANIMSIALGLIALILGIANVIGLLGK